MYGFIAYRVGNRADAEDLTQQTFEKAYRSWASFDESKASPKTWLLVIAHRTLIDHVRRQQVRPQVDDVLSENLELHAPDSDPAESSLGPDAALEAAIQGLSRREQEAVALRFGGDLNGPEIAQVLDISLANAQQILSRALRKLKCLLDDEPTAKQLRGERSEASDSYRRATQEERADS